MSGPFAYWDESVRALADVYDAIQHNTNVLLRVNGNTPDDPEPYPRPNGEPAVVEELSMAELFERTKGFNT